MNGWIGVDFDGTLSQYQGWQGKGVFGPPVPAMLERVKKWVEGGRTVKIVTARAEDDVEVRAIHRWLVAHGLPELEVTQKKDFGMVQLWDDRAVQVVPNTGQRADTMSPEMRHFLEPKLLVSEKRDYISFKGNVQIFHHLDALVKTGLYGPTIDGAAERLVSRGIEDLIMAGILEREDS